ncbi:hypothetical protein ABNF65_20025 [Paenibacillus larvae]
MLQGFPRFLSDDRPFQLIGRNRDNKWREWIGNVVPPKAAQMIAEEMLVTLLAKDFVLGRTIIASLFITDFKLD